MGRKLTGELDEGLGQCLMASVSADRFGMCPAIVEKSEANRGSRLVDPKFENYSTKPVRLTDLSKSVLEIPRLRTWSVQRFSRRSGGQCAATMIDPLFREPVSMIGCEQRIRLLKMLLGNSGAEVFLHG